MEVSKGQRLHIGIFGNTNAGKSSLMNMIIGQEYSIVSTVNGTTTDAVSKAMEFPGLGPVVFIDTAGFNDKTELSEFRLKKTYDALSKCDLILAVISNQELQSNSPEAILNEDGFIKIIKSQKPVIWVITKSKNCAAENKSENEIDEKIKKTISKIQIFKDNPPVFVDSVTGWNKNLLFEKINSTVPKNTEPALTENFCKPGENVLLVMPQDTQAPKGRLILPQVETIRDLLDRKVLIHSCTDDTFLQVLESLKNPPDLIITDSKLFKFVNENKPETSRLTSFSILQAAHKGDLQQFLEGAKAISTLTNNSKVLIAEACTHSPATEDIGTVKIPNLLKKMAPDIQIDFTRGTDFDLQNKNYDLIIHCGGCMFNRSYMLARQEMAKKAGIPMTNYGIFIYVVQLKII